MWNGEPLRCHGCGASDLIIVCRDCGTAAQDEDGQVAELMQIIADLRLSVDSAEAELRIKRMKIHRLEGDERLKLRHHRHYASALRVLKNWKELCHPGAQELESKERLKAVLARLDHYSPEQLEECTYGYSCFPYVVNRQRVAYGNPTQRRVEAEFIFRTPELVDRGIALAREARRREENFPTMPQPSPPLEASQQLGELGSAALRLAQWGFYVFPVVPKGKVPATANGFKDATRDEDRIVQFWLKRPEHNVGIRTGIESMLVVLDLDGDSGLESLRALEKRYGDLPRTASIVTPRGGQHFYFRHPGVAAIHNTASFPGPGLDVRGDGGYVLAPRSVGPNGRRYEQDEQAPLAALPTWLIKLLVERQSELPLFGRDYADMVRKGVREGERNSQLLSYGGHLWRHGHRPDEIFEQLRAMNDARCSPPLPNVEIRKIVESIARMEKRKAMSALRVLTGP